MHKWDQKLFETDRWVNFFYYSVFDRALSVGLVCFGRRRKRRRLANSGRWSEQRKFARSKMPRRRRLRRMRGLPAKTGFAALLTLLCFLSAVFLQGGRSSKKVLQSPRFVFQFLKAFLKVFGTWIDPCKSVKRLLKFRLIIYMVCRINSNLKLCAKFFDIGSEM